MYSPDIAVSSGDNPVLIDQGTSAEMESVGLLGSKRRDHGCYIKWPEHGMQKLHLNIYLGHLSDASLQSDLQLFIHTFTHRQQSQPWEATGSSSRAVRV